MRSEVVANGSSAEDVHVQATSRAVKLLDHVPPYNTHKIGVVYVGKGQVSILLPSGCVDHTSCHTPQTTEADILANTSGSSGFQEFLAGLGQLRRLANCLPDSTYLGGLDRGGSDGEFTYIYHDDITQGNPSLPPPLSSSPPPPPPVVFHVATLMPTSTSDPQCNNKKLHIGNDYVTVVYNDSGLPYQFGTIKASRLTSLPPSLSPSLPPSLVSCAMCRASSVMRRWLWSLCQQQSTE